jgi:hypothetical protein
MTQAVGYVAVVVRDYDEALAYFINVVGISKSGLLSGGGAGRILRAGAGLISKFWDGCALACNGTEM